MPRNRGLPQESSISLYYWYRFWSLSFFISTQVFLTPLASSSTVLRHAFLGLPLPRLPWGFHSRTCLAMSSESFRSVRPSHSHLRFLIWKSILVWFVRFYSSWFVIWFGQKILSFFLRHLLTFRHPASSIQDRRFATLQRTLFIYLINKYISLSPICLTVHHWYK